MKFQPGFGRLKHQPKDKITAMTAFMWKNYFKGFMKEQNVSTILKNNILFQDLSARQLKFVSNIVHLRKYRPNETIFNQGDAGVGMYIIANGAVNIIMNHHTGAMEEKSHETVIASLGPGDFFGELSLVEETGKRSARAQALETTDLIGFFKPDLLKILERSPTAGVKITLRLGEVLGRRLKETDARISRLEEELSQLKPDSKID